MSGHGQKEGILDPFMLCKAMDRNNIGEARKPWGGFEFEVESGEHICRRRLGANPGAGTASFLTSFYETLCTSQSL